MTAQTAREHLADALRAAEDRGDLVPCAGRVEWISEDHCDRREAAKACRPCPMSALCHAAALEVRPTHGVWASVDWTDPKNRPKRAIQTAGAVA